MKKLLFSSIIIVFMITNCFAQVSLSEVKTIMNFADICLPLVGTNNQRCVCNKISIAKTYEVGLESRNGLKYYKYLNIFCCEHCKYIQLLHIFTDNTVVIHKKVIFKSK